MLGIVLPNQGDLTEVDPFHTHLDIGSRNVEEPHLRFAFGDVRNRGLLAPLVVKDVLVKEHRFIAEVALLDRQAELFEDAFGHRHRIDLPRDDLEDAALQDQVREHRADLGDNLACFLQPVVQRLLVAPHVQRPSGITRVDVLQHADVVVDVTFARAEVHHGDRPGEVILQHFARDGPVEAQVGFLGRRREANDGRQ